MTDITSIVHMVSSLVGLLLISATVLSFCKHFKLPFTIALVLVGLGIAHASHWAPITTQTYFRYQLSPEFILYVCLPTLLFESAFSLNPRQLRRNLTPILTLAIPGLLISTFLIGFIVSWLTSIPLLPSLLLGAILSATDPIAVIALFKQLGAPKRLTVLIEGESLFNDATSIVTAKLILGVIVAGVFTSHQFWHGVQDFFLEFFGGVVVGWVIAIIVGYILGKVKSDPEIEISLTTILAYGTFIIAQDILHVSGVMATVAAGLTLSGWGRAKISPPVSQYLEHFWEFLAYIANALIFLLVGLSVNLNALWSSLHTLGVVVFAMLVSRALIIYLLIPLVGKLPGAMRIDLRYQTAIYWGGLRGAIALAIVLSLQPFGYNELFIALVMGSVLFTLIVKGFTMEKLVHMLKLDVPPLADRLAKEEAQLAATKEALDRIPLLQKGGFFSARIAKKTTQYCESVLKETNEHIETLREKELDENEEKRLIYLRGLAAANHLYYRLFAKGHLSERAYRDLLDIIVITTDTLRFLPNLDDVDLVTPPHSHDWQILLINIFEKLPLLHKVATQLRAMRIARDYEEEWGQYQGLDAILTYLERLKESQLQKAVMFESIIVRFAAWQSLVKKQLDGIAEQFPEFVTAMQERLAKRLILQAEFDAIQHQVEGGVLPTSVAKTMQEGLSDNIYKLREKTSTRIELDPQELLSKVPFCQHIPVSGYGEIIALLHERLTPADEVIIREGEKGQSLFLIMRGVVRVSKKIDGEERDVATLLPGDFFGEMALLHDERRTATCRAATPCSLYELRRSDFEKIRHKYPEIEKDIEKIEQERRT